MLLDLTAACDTINQNSLLSYLKFWFGLGGTVLKWFVSYLSNRCQAIKMGFTLSKQRKFIYGVPQGSVLGPLLFRFQLCAEDAQLLYKVCSCYTYPKLTPLAACQLPLYVQNCNIGL